MNILQKWWRSFISFHNRRAHFLGKQPLATSEMTKDLWRAESINLRPKMDIDETLACFSSPPTSSEMHRSFLYYFWITPQGYGTVCLYDIFGTMSLAHWEWNNA